MHNKSDIIKRLRQSTGLEYKYLIDIYEKNKESKDVYQSCIEGIKGLALSVKIKDIDDKNYLVFVKKINEEYFFCKISAITSILFVNKDFTDSFKYHLSKTNFAKDLFNKENMQVFLESNNLKYQESIKIESMGFLGKTNKEFTYFYGHLKGVNYGENLYDGMILYSSNVCGLDQYSADFYFYHSEVLKFGFNDSKKDDSLYTQNKSYNEKFKDFILRSNSIKTNKLFSLILPESFIINNLIY